MFTPITDHQLQAIQHLISQYRGLVTVEGTVSALVAPVQDLEDALVTLNTMRSLSTAVGIQLDLLGAVVGITRAGGQSDDDYRKAIRARVQRNVSQGEPQALIATFLLLTGQNMVLLDELFPASVMMESAWAPASAAEAEMVNAIIDTVAAAGVRAEGIISYDPDAAFAMDGNLPGQGFGDMNDPTVGGLFATYYPPGGEFAFAGDDPTGFGFGDLGDVLVGGHFVSL